MSDVYDPTALLALCTCRTVDARVVRLEQAGQEALARAGNILVARTAFGYVGVAAK